MPSAGKDLETLSTDAPSDAVSEAADDSSLVKFSEAKVMMVDDDTLISEVVQTYLEDGGYRNLIAINDPRDALDTARRENPDLLLLDLMMPGISGFDILAAIRADEDLKFLPVIVLTAATDPSSKLKALELGASEFLAKPVDPSELLLRVRNSLAFKVYQDHLAYSDAVTGLPNRRIFMRRLIGTVLRSSKQGGTFALVHIDLDRFKNINETFGHQAGDHLLKTTGDRLNDCLRGTDMVGRLSGAQDEVLARTGGDEFAILLPGLVTSQNAAQVTRRLLQSIAKPLSIGGKDLFLTASAGIAVYPGDGVDSETLLKNAEFAMYQAKQNGRNRQEFYSSTLNEASRERLRLESDLHRALERNELILHYQPKVDLQTNSVVGAEALLRWQHPELGLLPPLTFISIAEESGLIVSIGDWIIAEACRQGAAWCAQGLGDLRIAVNVSSYQLNSERILGVIKSALDQSGFAPSSLILELTESLLMNDAASSIQMLEKLKALGACLSIDDFGTGYSSLSYLKRFPLDELKIDRSFVSGLPADETDVSIVRAIIALAHSLNLKVVAEGVETIEQLDALRVLNCATYQGYFFSRALPAGDFATLTLERNSKAVP